MDYGDNFYITLPSNASTAIYPNNTKAAYVTSLNVPIMLNGEFEVALTNIACSSKIEHNIGKIHIENLNDILTEHVKIPDSLQQKWEFDVSTDQLEMSKNLEEIERKICFYQLFLNNFLFEKQILSQSTSETTEKKDINVFYDLKSAIHITNKQNFYLPYFNLIPSFIKTNTFEFVSKKYISISKENLFEQVPSNYKIKLIPVIMEWAEIKPSIETLNFNPLSYWENNEIINTVYGDKLKKMKNSFDELFKELKSKLSREDYGLFTIKIQAHAQKLNEIKFLSSFKNIILNPIGVCCNIFNSKPLQLDSYYFVSSSINSVNYAVVYCDVIDAQIFGDSLSQILQVVPMNNTNKESQLLITNLDTLQYVKVKNNFIDKIKINIRDLNGNPIKFHTDNSFTVVKLHFRKIL